jgi:superfamily II DNA or RNA helicase
MVSAPGTGTTLVSIRVANELGSRLVLFVVSMLDLAAQNALARRRDGDRSEPLKQVSGRSPRRTTYGARA